MLFAKVRSTAQERERTLPGDILVPGAADILNNGHVVFDGTNAELKASPDILARYVGV